MASNYRPKAARRVTHLDAMPEGVLLYTKPQMAAALQVSVRCLTGMMARGEISYFKIHGRNVRFLPVAALRRLIETSLLVEGADAAEAMADGRWLKAEHLFPARFCREGACGREGEGQWTDDGGLKAEHLTLAQGISRCAAPHPAYGHLLPNAEKGCSPERRKQRTQRSEYFAENDHNPALKRHNPHPT